MKIKLLTTNYIAKIRQQFVLLLMLMMAGNVWGQTTSVWNQGTANGAWLTAGNWTPSGVPNANVIAQYANAATGSGINTNTTSANNAAAIDFKGTAAFTLGNSAGSATGTLTLAGVTVNSIANTIVRNSVANNLTLAGHLSGSSNLLTYVLGNSTDNVVNIESTGNITISGPISGPSRKLTKVGTGAGILILSGANSYSGATTITAGTLQLGVANAIPVGNPGGGVVLNGGTFKTGATTGFSDGSSATVNMGTLTLSNSSTIALGTGNHNLYFANSSAATWAGTTLTVIGWTGTAGTAGTAGKIFVGNTASGLTAAQLAKITFSGTYNGITNPHAMQLSTGEVVPAAKSTPTISGTGSATNIIYGQTLAASTISGFTGSVAGTFAFTTPTTAPNAGTASYGVTFTPTDTTNYNTATTNVSVITEKATPTVTATGTTTYTYNGTPQGPDSATNTGNGTSYTYSYSGTENGGLTYGPSATKPTNAGSYALVANVATTTNFNAASSTPLTFTIDKAGSTISITGDSSYAFDGNPHGPTTYDHTGSSGNVTFEYTGVGATTYPASSSRPSAVGTYKAVATLAADNNYNNVVSGDFNFSITSVAVPEITSALTWSLTYGVAAAPYTVTASGNPTSFGVSGLPSGLNYNSTKHEITGTPSVAPGDYNVSLTATNEGGTSAAVTLVITITKKDITIAGPSVANKIYDATNTATLSGTLNDVAGTDDVTLVPAAYFDDVNGNVGDGKPVTSTSILIGTKASYYTLIQPTGLRANITKATPIVTATSSTIYKYNGSAQGPASATVTPSAAGTATYSYSGIENGGVTYDPTATKPTNAGSYSVIATVAESSNYTAASSSPYAFTIGKGDQTILGLSSTETKTYGDASYNLSATSTSGLPVSYTSSDTSVATITGSSVTIVGSGTATITATQEGDANWSAAPNSTQTLTVNKKGLTITGLTAQDKVYDHTTQVVVNGTPQYSGLVNGESFPVAGTVTWAFADKNVGAGKLLVQTGNYAAASANYTVVQPVLQAAITKKNIVITAITANDKPYDGTITATFSNTASADIFAGDTVNFEVLGSFSDANAGNNKAVTVLTINLSGTDSGNYNIPILPTGLTANITKLNQTIIFDTLPTVNVGATINLVDYTTTTSGLPLSFVSSISSVASITGTTLTGNNAGNTVITVSQPGNINYNPASSLQQTLEVVELPVALAQWDFFGLSTSATATTVTAKNRNSALNSASGILTRGAGAAYSSGSNSFRTTGFENNGISVNSTDYFQTSFTATQEILSLSSIRAHVIGTSTFTRAPGVQVQFAYSLNGTTYTLINSPVTFQGDGQLPDMNLASVAALQSIAPGTTVYFRFYASGQTTTGGYGFSSPASGQYGLEFYGNFKPTAITWNGFEWSNFNGPDGSQNAIIDGTYVQSAESNPLQLNNLNITSNGGITIQANQGITVNGDITTPNDKITIESDGSLVQTKLTNGNSANTVLAKRKVNMRISDYTYWSSPVANQVLRNTVNGNTANSTGGFSPGTPNSGVMEYFEPTDNFKVTQDAVFKAAKGYAIRGKSTYGTSLTSDELNFRGNLNNGDQFIQIQKSKNTLVNSVSTEHGYNLIGNPYPSNIDFYKLYNLNQGNGILNSDIILGAAWFWSNVPGAPATQAGSSYEANNYATLSLAGGVAATGNGDMASPEPNEFIKVAQGFIVQMRTAAPSGNTPDTRTLKFDNSIRTNNSSGSFFNNSKGAVSEINRFRLQLVSPYNIINTILVAHMEGATNDFDPDYDAELFSVGDDSFYSRLAARKLQIQARTVFTNEDAVQIGTKYSATGTYKIKLSSKEGIFNDNQKIYLHDKLTNAYVDITSQDYSFTATKGTDDNRFEIVYKDKQVLGTDQAVKSDFTVYRNGGQFVVRSSKNLGNVALYDVSGKLIRQFYSKEKELNIDADSLPNGMFIIKAENSGEVRTKKIIK